MLATLPLRLGRILLAGMFLLAVIQASAAGLPSLGAKRLLFMRVAFFDDRPEPISELDARQLMASVNDWFVENSYGKFQFTTDVTPLLTLPESKAWYGQRALTVLLDHARALAAGVGFNAADYDLDIARFNPVPGWAFSGLGLQGRKGLWLQTTHAGVVVHELGHNLGLNHANAWKADVDSVIGPGINEEYGNSFDTMAIPLSDPACCDFGLYWKRQLEWLSAGDVTTVVTGGTYRIYAYDVPALAPGKSYGLKIPKDADRDYWVEFRQKINSPWTQSGVLINWGPWWNSRSGTQLLDTTPGPEKEDAPLVVGRTLSDRLSGIHLTPIGSGGTGSNRWIDLRINLGKFLNNRDPQLALSSDQTNVAVGEPVSFQATAQDPDGDEVAFAWDFCDRTFGANSNVVTKSWAVPGRYVVRCTVSDLKGGLASSWRVITVGQPTGYLLSGRILDAANRPVRGVRVHNGQTGASYRGSETDSDGRYVVSDVDAGVQSFVAVKYGYTIVPEAWAGSLTLSSNVFGAHWRAGLNSKVEVVSLSSEVAESSNPSSRGIVRLIRSNPLTTALTVNLRLGGIAMPTFDYILSPSPAGSIVRVTIPSGAETVDVELRPVVETLVEGRESVTMALLEDPSYRMGLSSAVTLWLSDPNPLNNVSPVAGPDFVTRYGPGVAGISWSNLLTNDSDPDGDGVAIVGVDSTSILGAAVFSASGIIHYSPPEWLTSDDAFHYTIADGRGGSATGTVFVEARTPTSPTLGIVALGGSRVISGTNGSPGLLYRVEYTGGLPATPWQTLGAVTNDAAGQFQILDPFPTTHRYYRAVFP